LFQDTLPQCDAASLAMSVPYVLAPTLIFL
jgi:hypothetical protein